MAPIQQAMTGIRCALLLSALSVVVLAGCYDGTALVDEKRSTALNTRLAEVDLGTYRTTLPRDRETARFTDVNVHVFGTVPRSRLSSVKKSMKFDEYRLRHELLAAVRSTTREELTEPNLAQLRARLQRVVNNVLRDAPIKSVGFYQVMLRQG